MMIGGLRMIGSFVIDLGKCATEGWTGSRVGVESHAHTNNLQRVSK